MDHDLDLRKAIDLIKYEKAKNVVIQLPDGLKPRANEIVNTLESWTYANITIWAGSCFGACDTPILPKEYDLLIQWGHSPWKS